MQFFGYKRIFKSYKRATLEWDYCSFENFITNSIPQKDLFLPVYLK
jgi:hypothetical protein